MTIERWRPFAATVDLCEPFRGLSGIQAEMDHLLDSVFSRPAVIGGVDRVWTPALDTYETKDELVVSCELPGVKEKEVHVSIADDLLTIKGERTRQEEVKDDDYHRLERWYGRFERTIPLTVPVETDKVKATYRDGVLQIRLPKAEAAKPKEVKIDIL